IGAQIARIQAHTDMPIAVGFGIAQPHQVAEVAESADAVVVGSAIVRRIGEYGADVDLVAKVGAFVGALTEPLKEGAHGG
ncbi:MAG: tryptophan synthase subunit alpha, partial [Candidatus Latescibacteria bacterium]|nr:tryptophan synthase subunit alpha [Candidatus Latescibacterota bacterium]